MILGGVARTSFAGAKADTLRVREVVLPEARYLLALSMLVDGLGSGTGHATLRGVVLDATGAPVVSSGEVTVWADQALSWQSFPLPATPGLPGLLLAAGTYYIGVHVGTPGRLRIWGGGLVDGEVRNLVRNPSVETNATDWQAYIPSTNGGTQAGYDPAHPTGGRTDDGRFGTRCFHRRFLTTLDNPTVHVGAAVASYAVTPGQRLALRISGKWLGVTLGGAPYALEGRVRYLTGAGAFLSEHAFGQVSNPAHGQWVDVTGEHTVPASAAYAGVMVYALGAWGNINGVRNPSVETNTTDLTGSVTSTGGTGGAQPTPTRVSTQARFGSWAASWAFTTQTGGSAHVAVLRHQSQAAPADVQATGLRLYSGSRIVATTASVYLPSALPAGATLRLDLACYDANGAYLSTVAASSSVTDPAAARWHDLSFSFLAAAGTVYALLELRIAGLAAGTAYTVLTDGFYAADLPTARTPTYIDGDQPGSTWAGTAHASRSGEFVELRADAAQIVPVASGNPEYFDGDQIGFKWEGAAHASASSNVRTTYAFAGGTPTYPDADDLHEELAVAAVTMKDPVLRVSTDPAMVARLALAESQRLRAHAEPEGTAVFASAGWHDTAFDPNRGAYAIVRSDGPLADWVGEWVRVTAAGVTRTRAVTVYVVDEGQPIEDISLSRRAFLALAPLASTELDVTVQVMA